MTTSTPVLLRPAAHVSMAVAGQEAMAGKAATGSDARAALGLASWRAAERLAARALLRELLAREFGAAMAGSPIGCRPSGQPYLPRHPRVAVSLSHDSGYLAAAVAVGVEVGVDVQAPAPATEALIRRCCDRTAQLALAAMPEQERAAELARIWTVQEACVKATGSGFAGRPWTIPVPVGSHAGRWGEHRWRSYPGACPFPVSVAYGGALP
jgi:4'-phosphopantetheinyl transferase